MRKSFLANLEQLGIILPQKDNKWSDKIMCSTHHDKEI